MDNTNTLTQKTVYSGSVEESLVLANYPLLPDLGVSTMVDLSDLISTKVWRRLSKAKRLVLLSEKMNGLVEDYEHYAQRYTALVEDGIHQVSDYDLDQSESPSEALNSALSLSQHHVSYSKDRLESLKRVERALKGGDITSGLEDLAEKQIPEDEARGRSNSLRRVLSKFESGDAFHVPSLSMPESSVTTAGKGLLTDIVEFEGLSIAAGGKVYIQDLTYQSGIILLPRERWPFDTMAVDQIRSEWSNRSRPWGDETGALFKYRGKEFVCVGSPDLYIGSLDHYQNSLNNVIAQYRDLEGQYSVDETRDVVSSVVDYKEAIMAYAKIDHEREEQEKLKDSEDDLFAASPAEFQGEFEGLSLQDQLMYANWFDSHIETYDYLIWLNQNFGPFDNSEYDVALIEVAAIIEEERSSAKDLLTRHRGLSNLDSLLDIVREGSPAKVVDSSGQEYIVKKMDAKDRMGCYSLISSNGNLDIILYGDTALGQVVFKIMSGASVSRSLNNSVRTVAITEPVERAKPHLLELKHPDRKLGLSKVNFSACGSNNTEVMAAIALSNLKKGEKFELDGDIVEVKAITQKNVTLSGLKDGEKTSYNVATPKLLRLIKDVSGEIAKVERGGQNPGLVQALCRDIFITSSEDGRLLLKGVDFAAENSDVKAQTDNEGQSRDSEAEASTNLESMNDSNHAVQQQRVIDSVIQKSSALTGTRTVLFRMLESGGSLNGAICGLTDTGKTRPHWFLITRGGSFHLLSQAQTKQLCDRIVQGAQRELIFDSINTRPGVSPVSAAQMEL